MIEINGLQTQMVTIDITESELIDKVIQLAKDKLAVFKTFDYIEKGNIFVVDGYDHHHGDLIYKNAGPANEQQLAADCFIKMLISLKN